MIDYDFRRRGAKVESSRDAAIEELSLIKNWLDELEQQTLDGSFAIHQPIDVKSEVTLEQTSSVVLSSSLIRELVFTSSHAVHHFCDY